MSNPVVDISDAQKEFADLNQELQILHDRFLAIAMDYGHYIEYITKPGNRIYDLRDNVAYRLFSVNIHIELLIRQHYYIRDRFEHIWKADPSKLLREVYPSNPIFDYAEREVSSIFDSIIYHLVSVFDYLASLAYYTCRGNKQETLMWTSFASSVRDKNNDFSKSSFAEVISEIDNNFVKKLYDHRSDLIHRNGELNRTNGQIPLDGGKFKIAYITTPRFNKRFPELKTESKEFQITVQYASFWITRKAIKEITRVLLGLRKEMELTKKIPHGMTVLIDEVTGGILPMSGPMWHLDKYEKFSVNPVTRIEVV